MAEPPSAWKISAECIPSNLQTEATTTLALHDYPAPGSPASLGSPQNPMLVLWDRSLTNRPDDPEYTLRLIGQVITVSLETVEIVNALPDLGLSKGENVESSTTAKATTMQ